MKFESSFMKIFDNVSLEQLCGPHIVFPANHIINIYTLLGIQYRLRLILLILLQVMFDGTNTNTNSSKNGDGNSVETCEECHSQICVNQSPVSLVFVHS